ncbi:cupin domain-containing protein [Burkholderia vietnamiensis]|uniref:cupin domain-containing protein n=1 Tax=Burkholderia vietnamiensis TaxID=60552 RepID=UPI00158D217A|nr:regulator [Burkholderia vietnamiensis]
MWVRSGAYLDGTFPPHPKETDTIHSGDRRMTVSNFDASAIAWQPFGEFPHFAFFIMNVDMEQRIADVIFRFDAGRQIVSHRHTSLNHTFVVQGEHYIYEHDGSLREARPAGSYTITPAAETPHREGGGDEDAIVLLSMRPQPGELLYEILSDDGTPIAEISLELLHGMFEAQQAARV